MGLPIYVDPEVPTRKSATQREPEAGARSAIRRRPRRSSLPLSRSNAGAHRPTRSRLPPPAFFEFLENSPRIRELYDNGTGPERSILVERFLERRHRDPESRRQPTAANTPAAVIQDLSHQSSARERPHIDTELHFRGHSVSNPFLPSNPAYMRPRSRRSQAPLASSDAEMIQRLDQNQGNTSRRVPNQLADSGYWDTFLSTITPDPSLPSANSSFSWSSSGHGTQDSVSTNTNPNQSRDQPPQARSSRNLRPEAATLAPRVFISPPYSPSSRSPHYPESNIQRLSEGADPACDSDSDDSSDAEFDAQFEALLDRENEGGPSNTTELMVRSGYNAHEIGLRLRNLPWDVLSTSSIVSNARRDLETLAAGGEVPDSFWESAGLMTVLEHERRVADLRSEDQGRG